MLAGSSRVPHGTMNLMALAVILAPHPAAAQESSNSVEWFQISGTHRSRYEHLQHKYAEVRLGTDAALWLRTTLLAELRSDVLTLGIELADSRVYLTNENTPLGPSFVNPLDILQAYVSATIPDPLSRGDKLLVRFGRQTIDVGSRRFVARNRFRNTTNSQTGFFLAWTGPETESLHAFGTVPVERRSSSTRANDPRFDIERAEVVFWGILLRSRPLFGHIHGELQIYGLHETDSDDYPTRNRNFVTPGLRIVRDPEQGFSDFEFEFAVQAGTSRLTSRDDDLTDLSHLAFLAHGSVGHTFTTAWTPRLLLQYDYASGDDDPSDAKNGRFDTLYGARRFEFGPTGTYGALARSNISSPGIRVELLPRENVDGFVGYRAVWLAQARDAWVTTGIQDADGGAANFLGHQIEGRLRWGLERRHVTLEAGFARLWLGRFPRDAPNGIPDARHPFYVYTQVSLRF